MNAIGLDEANLEQCVRAAQRDGVVLTRKGKLGQIARAVTLLRAALAAPLFDKHRGRVEQELAACLDQARKELQRASPKTRSGRSSAAS